MKVMVIITAAGTSSRFGSNKQLTDIGGIPVFIKTCRAFSRIQQIDQVVITAHPSDKEVMINRLEAENLSYTWQVVEGGSTRAISVKNAVETFQENEGMVMIHDSARAFVTKELILTLIKASSSGNAVIPTLPIRDTLKKVINGVVVETVNRDEVRVVQTPQVFKKRDLEEAYASLDYEDYTDESGMIEDLGISVKSVDGDHKNIKITYASDLS